MLACDLAFKDYSSCVNRLHVCTVKTFTESVLTALSLSSSFAALRGSASTMVRSK